MSLKRWAIFIGLLGGVGALLVLGGMLGTRWSSAPRVLFVVPTMEVDPLPPLARLPLPASRFDTWQQPRTGIDSPLLVAEVQRLSPGAIRFAVPPALIPLYPTTPPMPPLASAPLREGLLPYGGDGCAPRGVPVEGTFNQGFHPYHLGIDIGVQVGTPIRATHSGTVVYADWSEVGYGYLVILRNAIFTTYYAHNSALYVQSGEQVGRGSVIAASGSSGNSTGPHLHYEVRIDDVPVDPMTFEEAEYLAC